MSEWLPGLDSVTGSWMGALWRAAWEGTLAIALAWLVCRALPHLPPGAQCWLWRLACLKLLVALCWTTPVELPLLPAPRTPPAAAGPATGGTRLPPVGLQAPGAVVPGLALSSGAAPIPPAARSDDSALPRPLLRGLRRLLPADSASVGRPFPFTTALALLWATGALACGVRLLRDHAARRALERTSDAVADASLAACCRELSGALGIRRPPRLALSRVVAGPVVVGALSPIVVLPASAPAHFSTAEMRMLLAHELAHVRRRDLLWNWLAAATCGLFFFHPLVWLACREWRHAQETECDALATRATGAGASEYGRVLLRVVTQSPGRLSQSAVALCATGTYRDLKRRLRAMTELERRPPRGFARLTGLLAILALMLVGLLPWRLTARPPEVRGPLPRVFVGWPGRLTDFSPDGRLMAYVGRGLQRDEQPPRVRVELWDVRTGRLEKVLEGHSSGNLYSLAFTADGRSVVLAQWNPGLWAPTKERLVTVWDVRSGARKTLSPWDPEHETWRSRLGPVHPVLDTPPRRPFFPSSHDTRGWDFIHVLSPGAKLLATSSGNGAMDRFDDGVVRVWDMATGRLQWTAAMPPGRTNAIGSLAFSTDGKVLAGSTAYRAGAPPDGCVRLWDARTGAALGVLNAPGHYLHTPTFSPDGRLLAATSTKVKNGRASSQVLLWEIATGQQLAVLRGESDQNHALGFSLDGQTLAVLHYPQYADHRLGKDTPVPWKISLWDVPTLHCRRVIASTGRPVAFAPDGDLLVAASWTRDDRGTLRRLR